MPRSGLPARYSAGVQCRAGRDDIVNEQDRKVAEIVSADERSGDVVAPAFRVEPYL